MPVKPLKVVMIRRGNSKVTDVPAENLVTFIRRNMLLGSDELSGDGKSWVRVDRHYQLRKYFTSDDQEKSGTQDKQDSDVSSPAPPPGLEGELEEMASLMKDINGLP